MFTADPYFWQANLNTLCFTLYTVIPGVFLALVLANVLNNQRLKGRNVYRGIFFLPLVCAPTAVALVWRWIVFNSTSGFVNYALSLAGIQGPNWIADPKVIMATVSIVAVWGSVGYDMVLLLAGLQGISRTYYEAAVIDGAGPVKRFFYVTMPLISPTLFFVLTMRLISAVRQFDLSFMFAKDTDPAFLNAQTLLYEFYRETFVKLNANYGSAIVVWSVAVILLFTALQFGFEKKWVHYDN
jgi:multiple sugar transport system permease protein